MRTGPIVLTVSHGVGLFSTFVAQHLYPGSSFGLIACLFLAGEVLATGPLIGPFDKLFSYDTRGYKLLDEEVMNQLLEFISAGLLGIASVLAVSRLVTAGCP